MVENRLVRIIETEEALSALIQNGDVLPQHELMEAATYANLLPFVVHGLSKGHSFVFQGDTQGDIAEIGSEIAESLEIGEDELPYTTTHSERELIIKPVAQEFKTLELVVSEGSSNPARIRSLVDLFSSSFAGKSGRALGEEIRKFLYHDNGELRIQLVDENSSPLDDHTLEEYAKVFRDRGKFKDVDILVEEGEIRVRQSAGCITIPLQDYAFVGVLPGELVIGKQRKNKTTLVDYTYPFAQNVSQEPRSDEERAFLAYFDLTHHRYRHMGGLLADNSVAQKLELSSRFRRQVARDRRELSASLGKLASLRITLDGALAKLKEVDRKGFGKLYCHSLDKGNLNGLLGEIVALGLMYALADKNRDFHVEAMGYGQRRDLQNPGYQFRSGVGTSIEVIEHVCEFDGLLVYRGIPIVVETKIGRRRIRREDVLNKKRHAHAMYGVEPEFLSVRVLSQESEWEYRKENNTYCLRVPLRESIYAKAKKIIGERW